MVEVKQRSALLVAGWVTKDWRKASRVVRAHQGYYQLQQWREGVRLHKEKGREYRDFSAYISGSHKRTRSQCKKVYIFPNFDEKNSQYERKISQIGQSAFMNIAI